MCLFLVDIRNGPGRYSQISIESIGNRRESIRINEVGVSIWLVMSGHDRPWLAMAGHGRPWPATSICSFLALFLPIFLAILGARKTPPWQVPWPGCFGHGQMAGHCRTWSDKPGHRQGSKRNLGMLGLNTVRQRPTGLLSRRNVKTNPFFLFFLFLFFFKKIFFSAMISKGPDCNKARIRFPIPNCFVAVYAAGWPLLIMAKQKKREPKQLLF